MAPTLPQKSILEPHDVARLMNVKRKTVYRWLAAGKIPGHKIGGVWRVYRVDLPQPRGKA